MLTKRQIKLILSLGQKKFRNQYQLFVVEGVKGIKEFLNSNFELDQLYSTQAVFDVDCNLISEAELKKISALKAPNTALAIFKMPAIKPVEDSGLIVALDDVRDPGNLGTIIRLCDWFGVEQLVCGMQTVDCYNPKVVQATMGSLTRVAINYVDLEGFLKNVTVETFGAFMDGENVYSQNLPDQGILVLGNEANGISEPIQAQIDRRVSIPRFGNLQATESLNVATATAVLLSEFRRA